MIERSPRRAWSWQTADGGLRSLAYTSTVPMPTRSIQSSPVRAESRRSDLRWTTVEQKIRKLHAAAIDELTEEQSRRLFDLELTAARHGGASPRSLLEKAKRILPNG